MTILGEYQTLAPQTVTLEPLTTTNLYGAPEYGTAASYSALVVRSAQLIAGNDNREVTSRTQVYIPSSSASVAEQDRLTLPDGTQPRIIRVDVYSGDKGQHNVLVHCG